MPDFSDSEFQLLRFISDTLHRDPAQTIVRLDTFIEIGNVLSQPTEDFPAGWASLNNKGLLHKLTDEVSEVTPTGYATIRSIWR